MKSKNMDPRKKKSREKLKQALLDLLENNTLENITIEKVTAAAGVSRPTFYANFPDMEAIIIEHVRDWLDLTESLFVKYERNREILPEQRLALFFEQLFATVITGDDLLLLALRGRAGEAALQAVMTRNVEFISMRAQDSIDQSLSKEDIYTLSIFYGSATTGVLEAILSKKLQPDIQGLATKLASLVHRGVGEQLGRARGAD
jgi:AcrR family transcriptional regulator